ncbi:hypothetical protein [Nonomuraea guangzhouensis]|uniref:Metallo-beta-lactamase domain-containing protein n=1 Tax=Nonomuraea guangzhouensis TaxID=1291555 RepID=A0ABW4GTR6_9ACTN|nr:hypothetical protein [Nonomuraea guangzhouensis]
MPWKLDICTIDVGQGESSIIHAYNSSDETRRSMLIDGGKSNCARRVHEKIQEVLDNEPLDHMVVSHYDADHHEGVLALLVADNLHRIADTIARATLLCAETGRVRMEHIAAGASGAMGACRGIYPANGKKFSDIVELLMEEAFLIPENVIVDKEAAEAGRAAAEDVYAGLSRASINNLNPQLNLGRGRTSAVVDAAGIAAADAIAGYGGKEMREARVGLIRTNILGRLYKGVKQFCDAAQFDTDGNYANTHVIDTGPTGQPQKYVMAVEGKVQLGDATVQAPDINRRRTAALGRLGTEVLWNAGPTAKTAPEDAPAVFILAASQYVWQGPRKPKHFDYSFDRNETSVGLVVRFNDFLHYAGGDLPSEGADLVATALQEHGLPNSAGGTYKIPHRIASFKCGHHGSKTSTSGDFLSSMSPAVAFISCGEHGYQHPDQPVVDLLDGCYSIERFYLTNCRYKRDHIPTSSKWVANQFAAQNKSRVCGDNRIKSAHTKWGDIVLTIGQDRSSGKRRWFEVVYRVPNHPGQKTDRISF